MDFYRSQWENALSDLKDAAHDGGVSPDVTDAWAVNMPESAGEPGTLGRYDAAGEFDVMALVESPDALRTLRKLYRTDAPQVPTRCDVCGAELVREDCPNYGNGAEHAAPDVRAFPV